MTLPLALSNLAALPCGSLACGGAFYNVTSLILSDADFLSWICAELALRDIVSATAAAPYLPMVSSTHLHVPEGLGLQNTCDCWFSSQSHRAASLHRVATLSVNDKIITSASPPCFVFYRARLHDLLRSFFISCFFYSFILFSRRLK